MANGSQVTEREPVPADTQRDGRVAAPHSIPGSTLAPQLPVTQALQEAREFRASLSYTAKPDHNKTRQELWGKPLALEVS